MERKDLDEIGRRMEKNGLDEWEIDKDLVIMKSAAGTYQIFGGSGGMISIDQITPKQEAAIKKEFNLKDELSFDDNPLIPDYGHKPAPAKKERKSKNSFDDNPLIPD